MGLTACSEEEVNTYSADEGIYFNQRIRVGNILTDSTNFTFVYIEESQNEATVSIPVQLVGRATDEPRPVNIKVVGGSAKEGDDLWSLAKRYSTSVDAIREVNDLGEGMPKEGDRILIFKENMSIL